jgi:hypothetical protein
LVAYPIPGERYMSGDTKPTRKKAKYDWPRIRHEYVTSPAGEGEGTLGGLCRKWGCSARRIEELSGKENWPGLREKLRGNAAEKARAKAEETAAQRLHRHAQIMRLIQARGVKAIQVGNVVPDAGKVLDAIKLERVLYGEEDVHAKVEITDRDRKMAAAYWKTRLQMMQEEQAEEQKKVERDARKGRASA